MTDRTEKRGGGMSAQIPSLLKCINFATILAALFVHIFHVWLVKCTAFVNKLTQNVNQSIVQRKYLFLLMQTHIPLFWHNMFWPKFQTSFFSVIWNKSERQLNKFYFPRQNVDGDFFHSHISVCSISQKFLDKVRSFVDFWTEWSMQKSFMWASGQVFGVSSHPAAHATYNSPETTVGDSFGYTSLGCLWVYKGIFPCPKRLITTEMSCCLQVILVTLLWSFHLYFMFAWWNWMLT